MKLLDDLEEQCQPILDQIGLINISKHHKRNYRLMNANIVDMMTHNITPAVYEDKTRGNSITSILSYMVLDHDGDKDSLEETLAWLRNHNLSYMTWASPSRKSKLKTGLYKTRIIIPTIGLTKGLYKSQFLQLLIDMGQDITVETDETAGEIGRYFYPPNMSGIKQPHSPRPAVEGDDPNFVDRKGNFWRVVSPKPKDQSQLYALESITHHVGKPYKAVKRFSEDMRDIIKDKVSYAYSERETVFIDDSLELTNGGISVGTFTDIIKSGVHVRCDCIFGEHETSDGIDQAFVSNGHIICESNTHRNIIGRPKSTEIVLDFDIVDDDDVRGL